MRRPHTHAARAFTIIELMFVILIIAIIGGIVTYNFVGAADKAKASATETSMKTVKSALSQYRAQYNTYPPTDLGLQALVTEKILPEAPKDAWGRVLDYYSPTANFPNGFELISYGGDGQANTADDLRVFPEPQ